MCAAPPQYVRVRLNSVNANELSCGKLIRVSRYCQKFTLNQYINIFFFIFIDHDMLLNEMYFSVSSSYNEKQAATFTCAASDAKPLSSIRLLKGNLLLLEGSTLFASHFNGRASVQFSHKELSPDNQNGNFLRLNFSIHSLRFEDAGEYHCVVISPFGKAIKSVKMNVQKVNLNYLLI